FDETFGATAVLDVRRAVAADGAEKCGVLLGYEGGKLRRHFVGKTVGQALFVSLGGASFGLRVLRGWREDEGSVVHERPRLIRRWPHHSRPSPGPKDLCPLIRACQAGPQRSLLAVDHLLAGR